MVEVAQTLTPCRFAAVPLGKGHNKPIFNKHLVVRKTGQLPPRPVRHNKSHFQQALCPPYQGGQPRSGRGSGFEPLLPRAPSAASAQWLRLQPFFRSRRNVRRTCLADSIIHLRLTIPPSFFLTETMRIYGACRLNLCAPPGSVKVREISARKLFPLQLLLQ